VAKNGKPSENKVKAPKVEKHGAKTKHRKGGDKARKLEPTKRLARVMSKFTGTSGELTAHKNIEAEYIRKYVRDGEMEPLSGAEFHDRLNRPRHKQVNPKKIARLLCPNAKW
jgi:hypothetical protein